MAWLVAPGGELHHTGARSPTLSPAQFGAAMGLPSGFTVLIILSAFLLHTSGLYIASSVGRYSLNVVSVYVLRVCLSLISRTVRGCQEVFGPLCSGKTMFRLLAFKCFRHAFCSFLFLKQFCRLRLQLLLVRLWNPSRCCLSAASGAFRFLLAGGIILSGV